MNWLTITWTAAAAASSTLAILYLMVWAQEPGRRVYGLFSCMALGAAGNAMFELAMLHATTVAGYTDALRAGHVPLFVLIVSLVWFVRGYFQTGRRWLALTVTFLWSGVLGLAMILPGGPVFKSITRLEIVHTFWGESYAVAVGVPSPWNLLSNTANLLMLAYVLDASWSLWRGGNRSRALRIGGSLSFFLVMACVQVGMVDAGVVHMPYMVSFCFLAIVIAMGYELGADVLRATALAREVASNELRWRSLLENVRLIVVGLDRDGRINFANPQLIRLTGYPAGELLGQPWFEMFLPPAERGPMSQRYQEYLDRDDWSHFQNCILTKSGDSRLIQWSNVLLRDTQGRVTGTLSVGEDITARARAELEARQHREELAHVTRVYSLGELSASIVHELNQPLTGILSNAQAAQRFLARNPPDLTEVREILEDIVQDDSRASEVIRRMRSLVKKGEPDFKPLGLAAMIRDVIRLLQSDAGLRGVQVSFEAGDDLPQVRGDRIQLQQVVLNLLVNAFEAMGECPESERRVTLRAEWNGDPMARVSVRDQGTGLSPDSLDRIFKPFFTSKRDGLDMGLSISRSIVEAHGGRLKAENNPDRGVTFTFTVPVSG
jgi:PAS domain S-box-containing protein